MQTTNKIQGSLKMHVGREIQRFQCTKCFLYNGEHIKLLVYCDKKINKKNLTTEHTSLKVASD